MPRQRKVAADAAIEIDVPAVPEIIGGAAPQVAPPDSHTFETVQWDVAVLTQAALLRRLQDDGEEGKPVMVAAELNAALAFLKLMPPRAPDTALGANPFAAFDDAEETE